jgi:hypothetical protein
MSSKVGESSSGTWDRSSMSTVDAFDPFDLLHRVSHRRLHPDAQHVELEQAEVFDVLLVELAHREAGMARLDRRPVQQRGVGQQDATGVQRDVARQSVERVTRSNSNASRCSPSPGGTQLGQLAQAAVASRARMWGKALAIVSISPPGMPSAAPTSRIACLTR